LSLQTLFLLTTRSGSGAFGRVVLAKEQTTDAFVAIKVVEKANLNKADFLRLQREYVCSLLFFQLQGLM
jgi:serine/threonine protein kinase